MDELKRVIFVVQGTRIDSNPELRHTENLSYHRTWKGAEKKAHEIRNGLEELQKSVGEDPSEMELNLIHEELTHEPGSINYTFIEVEE